MGELLLTAPVAGLTSKNSIVAEDVLMLRAEVFRDGVVTRGEAESLFALDVTCVNKCAEWPEFFVEAVSDYIVRQEVPVGYISEDNARWLVRAISRDGVVDSETELELLVSVLEKAKSSPASLSAYALQQVSLAVLDGKGPLAGSAGQIPGIVGKAEVDLLRRILFAYGGDGNIAITKAEAEVLFTINDRTVEEMNDPSWNDLFVKAIANFVLCASGYEAPTRDQALKTDQFFEDLSVDISGFFNRMVSGGVQGIFEAYRSPVNLDSEWEARNQRSDALARRAGVIDGDEVKWLADRIGRDRLMHDNERALLGWIKQASPSVHPDLQLLIDKVA